MRLRKAHRPLFVEQLETREVPAGNVTAQLIGDTLLITGDQFDNLVVLRQDDAGIHLGEQVYQGVNNIVMDLASDDIVRVGPLSLDGSLSIDTGAGLDVVDVAGLSVGGDVLIRTGTNGLGTHGSGVFPGGGESVVLHLQRVDGTLTIDTGAGDDFVNITSEAPGFDPMIGNLVVDTGEGNDVVRIETLEVIGDVLLDGGNGQLDDLIALFAGTSQTRTIVDFEQVIVIN
jgi:hypothetical protein